VQKRESDRRGQYVREVEKRDRERGRVREAEKREIDIYR